MMVAIMVDRRPRTCPEASITNHFGSMSPCFGKYVRMTLPETTRLFASSEFPRRRCEQPQREELQRQLHTFPYGKGRNGNTAEQRLSTASFPARWAERSGQNAGPSPKHSSTARNRAPTARVPPPP